MKFIVWIYKYAIYLGREYKNVLRNAWHSEELFNWWVPSVTQTSFLSLRILSLNCANGRATLQFEHECNFCCILRRLTGRDRMTAMRIRTGKKSFTNWNIVHSDLAMNHWSGIENVLECACKLSRARVSAASCSSAAGEPRLGRAVRHARWSMSVFDPLFFFLHSCSSFLSSTFSSRPLEKANGVCYRYVNRFPIVHPRSRR